MKYRRIGYLWTYFIVYFHYLGMSIQAALMKKRHLIFISENREVTVNAELSFRNFVKEKLKELDDSSS